MRYIILRSYIIIIYYTLSGFAAYKINTLIFRELVPPRDNNNKIMAQAATPLIE